MSKQVDCETLIVPVCLEDGVHYSPEFLIRVDGAFLCFFEIDSSDVLVMKRAKEEPLKRAAKRLFGSYHAAITAAQSTLYALKVFVEKQLKNEEVQG